MNTTAQKNELIFGYSSGNHGEAKSLFTSMYLYLNSIAAKKASIFDNMLAQNLSELEGVGLKKLKFTDCIKNDGSKKQKNNKLSNNPLSRIIGDLNQINWKTIYKGFKEFQIPVNDNDSVKLIKMDPGTSVPLHSHNGKEYILVLDGSFCDEYGEYNKGDMQINDQQIKHNPTACNSSGCICLSITENDVVFFGKFGSALNLFTFIKSFFK
ncbi:cupin domain-containing protein [Alphaproteobacteria bacterium]|nr:cupin domain-containing protein [Alphaproteobacteria bacterium]